MNTSSFRVSPSPYSALCIALASLFALCPATGLAQPSLEALLEDHAGEMSAAERMRLLLKNKVMAEANEIYYAQLEQRKGLLQLRCDAQCLGGLPPGLPKDLQVSAITGGRASLKWTDAGKAHSRRVRLGQGFLDWTVVSITREDGVSLENSLGEQHTIQP